MGLNVAGYVEKVNGKELSYNKFVERFLEKNQPVVLTGLMDDWRACRDWVTDNGEPNLHFFSAHFGNSRVQVADCSKREFNDQKRVEMSVSEFIDHWLELSAKDYIYTQSSKDNENSLLYLKDWHFVKEYPKYVPYTTPLFFLDDWLNLFLDSHCIHKDPVSDQEKDRISCSDYRFVYMGAKGTWTPLHADVFRSYSWSANVCGKKQWHLLSPSQCHLVFDRNKKRSVYDIFEEVSETKFPGFKKAKWLECTQEPNEIIFVPSGWYHQVHNLEDTISINHNWFNAYNLSWVWELIVKDYNEAKECIEDIKEICDDFEGLCQRNLAANTGMNFSDFLIFIIRFSLANLIELVHLARNCENPIYSASQISQHLLFNLGSMCNVALKMKAVALETYQYILLDFREVLEESEFLELFTTLGRTYGIIYEQQKQGSDINRILEVDVSAVDFIESTGSKVSGPEDLISIIDCTISKLGDYFSGEKIRLLSGLEEHKTFAVL